MLHACSAFIVICDNIGILVLNGSKWVKSSLGIKKTYLEGYDIDTYIDNVDQHYIDCHDYDLYDHLITVGYCDVSPGTNIVLQQSRN